MSITQNTGVPALSREDRQTIAAMVRLSLSICQTLEQDISDKPFISEIRTLVHRHNLQPEIEEPKDIGADADNLARIRSLLI